MTIKQLLSLTTSSKVVYRTKNAVHHIYTHGVFKIELNTNPMCDTYMGIYIAGTHVFQGSVAEGFPMLVTMLKHASYKNAECFHNPKSLFKQFLKLERGLVTE